jgi:predicted RNase H-like nuclease
MASLPERRVNLRLQMQKILAALNKEIEDIPIEVQPASDGYSFKELEDMIDALVCAWVGTKYLEQQTMAYGDSSAAIWVPIVPTLRARHI